MLSKTQIQQLHQNIAQHPAPVLSLYLSVNPANPDNNGKAYVLRAKEALERLEVPTALRKKVSQQLHHYIPQGRTRALFVAENLFEDYHLQVELPLLDPRAGVEAHWGTPYLTPLLFALDEHQRYGVVLMDQDACACSRCFWARSRRWRTPFVCWTPTTGATWAKTAPVHRVAVPRPQSVRLGWRLEEARARISSNDGWTSGASASSARPEPSCSNRCSSAAWSGSFCWVYPRKPNPYCRGR